jgi:hypothetical protein
VIKEFSVGFTTNGTVYLGSQLRGRILAVKVVADNSLTDSFDIALTGETTGVPILTDASVAKNATTWWYPRAFASQNTDGVDATDAFVEIWVFNERISAVIANAGTGVGTITVYYDSEG